MDMDKYRQISSSILSYLLPFIHAMDLSCFEISTVYFEYKRFQTDQNTIDQDILIKAVLL
jgi:hypothetical protein